MQKRNIELLQAEAQRLLSMTLNILQGMLDESGVIVPSQDGETQTFDTVTTPKHIEILNGELEKLSRFEMVLAVVGTMKAGKSTTINAIVGFEVLPNRNRPMTALPTLIEHTPGQLEPLLEFSNNQPIEKLTDKLRIEISRSGNKNVIANLIETEPHMRELLDHIEKKCKFKEKYLGSEPIFGFLKALNDIVRLSKVLGVEFPFSSYEEIRKLPLIKIEFVHLRETEQANGRLTLLDTPGPNESGQPHLRKMLKDQLTKASAVLAVLDFTQLKSDADAQVRDELQEIANVTEGRLFALVNKFDQKDRNGDSAEQVKKFVANNLMDGNIQESAVFPVSSKFAYLANCAKHELAAHQRLPDHNEQPWVADFGKETFGARWERRITDFDEVKKGAESLWEDSLFHAPLQEVIQFAQSRAAIMAIDSASAKIANLVEKIDNFLNVRETALTKNVKELRLEINSLQLDLERVEACEANAKKKATETLHILEQGSEKVFKKVMEGVLASVDTYFKDGKSIEKKGRRALQAEQNQLKAGKNRRPGLFFIFEGFFFPPLRDHMGGGSDFNPNSTVIQFAEKKDAIELLAKIQTSVAGIVSDGEARMKSVMNEALKEFQTDFAENVIKSAKKIVSEMEDRMKASGFAISLTVPDTSLLALDSSCGEILSDLISKKTESGTRSRRQTGAWGTVCSWFDSTDWGYESYKIDKYIFEVDIFIIKKSINKSVSSIFAGLDKTIAEQIRNPLKDRIKDFFDGFKKMVRHICGDLQQSVRDQESSKAEQENLTRLIATLKKNVPSILLDSDGLKMDVKEEFRKHMEKVT